MLVYYVLNPVFRGIVNVQVSVQPSRKLSVYFVGVAEFYWQQLTVIQRARTYGVCKSQRYFLYVENTSLKTRTLFRCIRFSNFMLYIFKLKYHLSVATYPVAHEQLRSHWKQTNVSRTYKLLTRIINIILFFIHLSDVYQVANSILVYFQQYIKISSVKIVKFFYLFTRFQCCLLLNELSNFYRYTVFIGPECILWDGKICA